LLFTDADRGEASTHVYKQDSGQIRPECFPGRYGSRVPARRKGGTSGMLRPDSAGIRPQQESGPGIRPPTNRNENRNVPPSYRWCIWLMSILLVIFQSGDVLLRIELIVSSIFSNLFCQFCFAILFQTWWCLMSTRAG
jgi:hypothetical protein